MLEGVSFILNNSLLFDITLVIDSQHGCVGQIEALVEDQNGEDEALTSPVYGKDIYDFFCKIDRLFQGRTDYKELRETFYGLHAIDKMKICNTGDCLAISKSKRTMYKEKYEFHADLEEFFGKLHKQITTIPDYLDPIENLTSEAEESIQIENVL